MSMRYFDIDQCIKDSRYQYFQRWEFDITSRVMLAWHIVLKFALDPKSTFWFVHQVAPNVMDSAQKWMLADKRRESL